MKSMQFSVNFGGSKTLQEARDRAKNTPYGGKLAEEWWNSYGKAESEKRSSYANLQADFEKREAGAIKANKERETEIRGTYADIISQYQSGGAFKAAGLADIEESKTKAIGAGTQQMISSGLYGTTTAASIPVQAENQAQKSRLKLEDILQQRTNEAKLGQAAFVERIQEPYPDYNLLVQAMAAKGAS